MNDDTTAIQPIPYGIKTTVPTEEVLTPERILILTVVLLTLILVTWVVLAWRGRTKKKKNAAISVSEWEVLRHQVDAMALPKEDSYDDWLRFSSEISVYSRRAVGRAVGCAAEDWTTEECEQNLLDPWKLESVATRDAFLEMLKSADAVRFAGRLPNTSVALSWKAYVQDLAVRCHEYGTRPQPLSHAQPIRSEVSHGTH